jgi:hypothetical protein
MSLKTLYQGGEVLNCDCFNLRSNSYLQQLVTLHLHWNLFPSAVILLVYLPEFAFGYK